MKKYLSLFLVFLFLGFMGCSSSTDEEKVNEFDVLIKYLESGDQDYLGWVNNLNGWIVNLADINTDDYYVMDFRAETDYNSKHIAGAVLTTLSDMFDKAAGTNKHILCVCYTGQTASYAHMLLRMKGYDAYVLKFGMSIYDESLDKWTVNCSNAYAGDFVKTASPVLPSFGYPTLSTGKKDGSAILESRIDEAVSAWAAGMLVAAKDIVPNAGSYNILNYWSQADYEGIGHIDGAYQLTPLTLKTTENLKVFDPAGGNILYCWTGQTAAATIAYLKVLGYDVKSIKFGTNAMIYDELPGHKWPKPWSSK
jgi:rhodanese-related sulfurtransferase